MQDEADLYLPEVFAVETYRKHQELYVCLRNPAMFAEPAFFGPGDPATALLGRRARGASQAEEHRVLVRSAIAPGRRSLGERRLKSTA